MTHRLGHQPTSLMDQAIDFAIHNGYAILAVASSLVLYAAWRYRQSRNQTAAASILTNGSPITTGNKSGDALDQVKVATHTPTPAPTPALRAS